VLAKVLERQHGQNEQEQRFRCSWVVVRGRVELPTFRFSGVVDVQVGVAAGAWTAAFVCQ
jgi:hypothetical protein